MFTASSDVLSGGKMFAAAEGSVLETMKRGVFGVHHLPKYVLYIW